MVGDSLYGGVRVVGEHLLGRENDEVLYPIAGGMARLLLDNLTEILRRQVEKAGIELHVAVLFAVLDDGVVKAIAQALFGIDSCAD